MSSDLPIFVKNPAVISAQSLAVSATSTVLDVTDCNTFTVTPVATGSSILGSIQLQGSADGVNFGNIGAAITLPAGNLIPVNYPDWGIPYLQVVFTEASGTGSLNVYISCKLG